MLPGEQRGPQAALLRDAFGNPFQRTVPEPSWLLLQNGTISKLAQGIYDDYAFDCLPILADALQKVGCSNEETLNHCRAPGRTFGAAGSWT
jgi:hypothetical protein